MIDSLVLNDDCEGLASELYRLGFANRTFFITGSTGLLGRILTSSIIKANYNYGLNNKIVLLARNPEKLQRLYKDNLNDFEVVFGDVKNDIKYNNNVDYVFHFASITSSKAMVEQPVEVIDTTINGTLNILKFSKEHNAKKVLFTSTMEVFGDTQGRFVKESDLGSLCVTDVRTSYPESKRMAENICASFASEYGLDVRVARLTQTFGAGAELEDKRIFSVIAKAVAEKRNVELASKGELVRDYCYTTDALSAMLYILKYGEKNGVYNVANPNTNTSVFDMAKAVAKQFGEGCSNVVVKVPENVKSMGFSKPSITRLNVEKLYGLGWKPKYDLLEMYERLIGYYKEIEGEVDEKSRNQ